MHFADISIATLLIIYLTIVTSRDEFTEDGEYYRTASNLTRVPRDIPPEALKVDISSNAITILEANSFSNLSVALIYASALTKYLSLKEGLSQVWKDWQSFTWIIM